MADVLDKWRRSGSVPVLAPTKETGGGAAVSAALVPYKPFGDQIGAARLLLKPGGVETNRALPYGYLTDVKTDNYGLIIGLTYSIPFPGPVVVQIEGNGLSSLAEAVIKGNVAWIEAFDPARHAEPQDNTPVVTVIHIMDKPPETAPEDATKH